MSNSKFQHCGHCLLSLWLPISCLVQHSSKTPFHCFDSLAALSIDYKCNIMPARGTKNFDIAIVYSGNRRQFTSMFNCASPALPCAGVACCQTKFQVPLTVLTRHPYFDEQYQDSVKHGKDCFYQKKKNELLRTVVFHHRKINAYGIPQNSFIQNQSPSAITCLSKRKGAFI